jgi:hypothetical protein
MANGFVWGVLRWYLRLLRHVVAVDAPQAGAGGGVVFLYPFFVR